MERIKKDATKRAHSIYIITELDRLHRQLQKKIKEGECERDEKG